MPRTWSQRALASNALHAHGRQGTTPSEAVAQALCVAGWADGVQRIINHLRQFEHLVERHLCQQGPSLQSTRICVMLLEVGRLLLEVRALEEARGKMLLKGGDGLFHLLLVPVL